jgi:hypothetical protein
MSDALKTVVSRFSNLCAGPTRNSPSCDVRPHVAHVRARRVRTPTRDHGATARRGPTWANVARQARARIFVGSYQENWPRR